jgi:hypothetical protein
METKNTPETPETPKPDPVKNVFGCITTLIAIGLIAYSIYVLTL